MLPIRLFRAEEVSQLDQLMIKHEGVSGYELMCAAGESALVHLVSRWPNVEMIIVVCGGGNNAGDGYVLARLALARRIQIRLLQLCDGNKLKGDALTAFTDYSAAGGASLSYQPERGIMVDWENTVIVDALLGTGLQRPLEGRWLQAVQAINNQKKGIVALDIPSGLDADTGCELGEAVKADMTVTFIGRKRGLYTANGRDFSGEIIFEPLGARESIYELLPADGGSIELLDKRLLQQLRPRLHNSHKGNYGHVLVIGGIAGYSGAVALSAMAAMRTGAGLVSIATHPVHAALLDSGYPEVMCHAVSDVKGLQKLIQSADVVVVGPGLGQSIWSHLMLQAVIDCKQPLLLDADALNIIVSDDSIMRNKAYKNRIITPHPGEAAALLSCGSAQIQHNRFASVRELAELYQATVVLKGSGSLVQAAPEYKLPVSTWVCEAGNPGMATAGMGDVLSGVIAALLAQGLSPLEATKTGVLIHSLAGDLAAREGQRGLIASDVVGLLRLIVNPA